MALSLDQQQFSKNAFLFGAEMHKHLPNVEKNVIYSPFSIQTCLTMAYLAAKGKTAGEMAQVMRYSAADDVTTISEYFRTIVEAINKEEGLRIVNKIYVKNSYKLKAEYIALVEKNFQAGIESLNFGDSSSAARTINSWVEGKTNNRIKDLISPNVLNDLTRTILVNCVYFKGKWQHPFDPLMTQPLPFWITPQDTIDVNTMNIKKHFRYSNLPDLDAQALELPYEAGSNITMLIILPNRKDGLIDLEKRMHEINLEQIDSLLNKVEVEVFLPKFEYEFEINLNEVLKGMGIKEAFNPETADFSGLLDAPEKLHISDVVHKAFIKVDEEGAEAAAATVAQMRTKRMVMHLDSVVLRINHPFIFSMQSLVGFNKLEIFRGSVKQAANKIGVHDEL